MKYVLLFFLLFFNLTFANGDDTYKLFEKYNAMKKQLQEIELQTDDTVEKQKEIVKDVENLRYVKKVIEEITEKYKQIMDR